MLTTLEKALALRSAPLFSALPAEALLPVAAHASVVELEAHQLLFAAGEHGDAMYVIVRGTVEVTSPEDEPLATLGEGECVGEMAVLDWEPRSATVSACAPTRLLRLEQSDLLDLLAEYPDLVRALISVLVERLRTTAP